jgi:hypothetical protein
MTKAMSIIAAASLLTQAAFFIGFGFLVSDVSGLRYVIAPDMREGSLLPYIQETIASYQAVLWAGLVGAAVYGGIYFRKLVSARWFLTGARMLAWLWFLLIPVGTLVGVVLIS